MCAIYCRCPLKCATNVDPHPPSSSRCNKTVKGARIINTHTGKAERCNSGCLFCFICHAHNVGCLLRLACETLGHQAFQAAPDMDEQEALDAAEVRLAHCVDAH